MNPKRLYETTFIVNAALEDQDIDSVVSKVISYVENNGGQIEEINKWGRRRLAYPISKKYNGYYVHLIFSMMPSSLPVVERFFVLEDTVLRHLILELSQGLREHRKEKMNAEGKSIEGTLLVVGNEELKPKPFSKSEAAGEGGAATVEAEAKQ